MKIMPKLCGNCNYWSPNIMDEFNFDRRLIHLCKNKKAKQRWVKNRLTSWFGPGMRACDIWEKIQEVEYVQIHRF